MKVVKGCLQVQNLEIGVRRIGGIDYLSLTDMVKEKDGDFFVSDWLRNRGTLEFLGIWESINNPDFDFDEYEAIRQHSGLNNFRISAGQWQKRTRAIGIFAVAGRYGGTFAQKDIAFEFGMWINPAFKLYLIKEYERLQAIESNEYNLEWKVRRIVSKANYAIQTSAVRTHLVEPDALPSEEAIAYADEADLVNLAVFGMTATKWRRLFPDAAAQGDNIRDSASINELIVLSNLESENAILIKTGQDKDVRFRKLKKIAKDQLRALAKNGRMHRMKRKNERTFFDKGEPDRINKQQELRNFFLGKLRK